MSGAVDVCCHKCLVWSMSYFTHSVVNVWCGECLPWLMSGCGECLVDMLCDECLWCLKMFEADFFHLDLSMVLKYIYCVMLIARTV